MATEEAVELRADLVTATGGDSVALLASGLEEVGTLLGVTWRVMSARVRSCGKLVGVCDDRGPATQHNNPIPLFCIGTGAAESLYNDFRHLQIELRSLNRIVAMNRAPRSAPITSMRMRGRRTWSEAVLSHVDGFPL